MFRRKTKNFIVFSHNLNERNSVFNNELRVSMPAERQVNTLKFYPKSGEEALLLESGMFLCACCTIISSILCLDSVRIMFQMFCMMETDSFESLTANKLLIDK